VNAYTWSNNPDNGSRYTGDGWVYPPTDMDIGDPFVRSTTGQLTDAAWCTVEREIKGLKRGRLWPYVMNEKVFHCPADKIADRHKIGYRSYSMINTVRNPHFCNTGEMGVYKMGDITSPSDKYLFLESKFKFSGEYHWNMGGFRVCIVHEIFDETPADWHKDGINLGFADGHAEKYKWKTDVMKDFVDLDDGSYVAPAQTFGLEDTKYFLRHIPRGDLK
jgi:prepilin-type processing-associated H-X9-DG protein